jgi:uridylate kinase
VYSADPLKHPGARRYRTLTYSEALRKSLRVMDGAAFALCRENRIPIVVFNFFERGSFRDVVLGKKIGTEVGE